MRAMRILVFLFLVFLSPSVHAQSKIDVFLIAGQSNAVGKGVASLAPVPEPGTAFQFHEGAISPAVDPVGGAGSGSPWPAFGSTYYALTKTAVLLVPCAVNGAAQSDVAAAIVANGTYSLEANGTLTPLALGKLDAAIAAVRSLGKEPTFRGVLWSQGETDGTLLVDDPSSFNISMYVAGFRNMKAAIRLRYSDAPIYIFRTGFAEGFEAGMSAVRDAQESFAREDSRVHIVFRGAVEFPAKGRMQDLYHYTQDGYNAMGAEGATAIVGLK